ncbi:ABC transporter permease [Desulfonatronum sp. SC1]|uniref:ABC transporter permease n=1 Tax=Desulfonatronum sp. SC1 TaxID=2109626 RepID=UPI000D322732|nr:ABC transporter permease [Desulfonatronum sp. SC1]PTN32240.1 ABC transporter permease [Desulfonatronum sp. SC1]
MGLRLLKKLAVSLATPLLFLGVWQIIALSIDNIIALPTVDKVFYILLNPTAPLISLGSLLNNVMTSFSRVLVGYALAVFVAVPIGLAMGYKPLINQLFSTFFGMFRPIPPLAWVPLVLAWFGITSLATFFPFDASPLFVHLRRLQLAMLFIIFMGAFFPILTSTIHGVRNTRKTLLESARTLGASEKDIMCKILIPAAAPSIVNGMRIGLGVAWMCLVSAEMLPGSVSGVGYVIMHAYSLARTDIVIAGIISIGLVGVLLDYSFRLLEHKKFSWVHKST